VFTLLLIGVGVAALAGFVVLLRWPRPEPTAESDEDQDREGAPPIIDVFSQSGG
jgi:hypothetical protein